MLYLDYFIICHDFSFVVLLRIHPMALELSNGSIEVCGNLLFLARVNINIILIKILSCCVL